MRAPFARAKMYSFSIALRRNFVPRTQHLKPLTALWRAQKTAASPVESDESLAGFAKLENEQSHTDVVRPFEDIPGPKAGFRNFMNFYKVTEGFTKGYKMVDRLFAEYGPIYKQHLFGFPLVHVIDPNDFERVFRADGKYPMRPPMLAWIEHRRRRNHTPGVFLSEGEEWHKIRQTIAPKIMRPKIVQENIDNFNAVTKDAVARFVKLKEACGPDDHIPDLVGEISKWSTESIGTVAFDARLGLYDDPPPKEALQFIEEVHNFFTITHKLVFSFWGRFVGSYFDPPLFKKLLKCGDTILDIGQGFVDKKMRELKDMAEKGIDPSDNNKAVPLLTYLLTKEDLTPEEVNGHAIDTVAGAVDNFSGSLSACILAHSASDWGRLLALNKNPQLDNMTSFSVVWLLYNLARFPQVQEKLYQEVESFVGKDENITTQHLAKLPYLKACMKESWRLTPVTVSMARILHQDVVLSGYNVPAQSCVIMEQYCTARSEKYFKDPLEFKPERWLRENKDEIHPFSNLPFGFGTRMCLGRRLAELEMHVFICKLLQRFRLEYHHEPLELYQKLITVPDKPVKIKFVDRL